MFIVAEGDRVIVAVSESVITMDQLKERYPYHNVLRSDFDLTPSTMVACARVFGGRVVLKPSPIITLSKTFLHADGEEEIQVSIKVYDLQPGEQLPQVTLNVDGVAIPVDLVDGEGGITLSTKSKGLHILSISDDGLVSTKGAFEAI